MNHRAPEWWHKTRGEGRITMVTIAVVREWSERILGAPSVLIIEREGGRNRVFLRFTLPSGIGECDVMTLWALKREQAPSEVVYERLLEVCRPVCVA